MTAGVHCAHFELRQLHAFVGVAGPGFNPAAGAAQRAFSEACKSAKGWMMYTYSGNLYLRHGGKSSEWAGQPREIKDGDVVVRRLRCAAPWVC